MDAAALLDSTPHAVLVLDPAGATTRADLPVAGVVPVDLLLAYPETRTLRRPAVPT